VLLADRLKRTANVVTHLPARGDCERTQSGIVRLTASMAKEWD
jgi:hypothetical protein